jgi:hypothetical protein
MAFVGKNGASVVLYGAINWGVVRYQDITVHSSKNLESRTERGDSLPNEQVATHLIWYWKFIVMQFYAHRSSVTRVSCIVHGRGDLSIVISPWEESL